MQSAKLACKAASLTTVHAFTDTHTHIVLCIYQRYKIFFSKIDPAAANQDGIHEYTKIKPLLEDHIEKTTSMNSLLL
jgi:hypothetical protein